MLDATNWTTRFDGLWERYSDRLNPMVVRDVRQSLKNRLFLLVFFLLLTASWLTSTLGVLSYRSILAYVEVGPDFFRWYLIGLIGCLVFVVPAGAFFSMSQEFRDNAFEVLAVTTLSPSNIVFGKLQGTLVMILVYASAVAPFLSLSYLLGGIGLINVLFSLLVLGMVSLTLSLFALMMGSLAQKPWLEVLNLIILLIASLITSGVAYAMLTAFVIAENLNLADQIFGMICFGVFLGFMSLISLAVAQAQLTTTYLPLNYRRNPLTNAPHPLTDPAFVQNPLDPTNI